MFYKNKNILILRCPEADKDHRDGALGGRRHKFCDAELQQPQLPADHAVLVVQDPRGSEWKGVRPSELHGAFRPTGILLLRRNERHTSKSVQPRPSVWAWVNLKEVCCFLQWLNHGRLKLCFFSHLSNVLSLLTTGNVLKTVLIILFIVFLLTIFLIVVVYRWSTNTITCSGWFVMCNLVQTFTLVPLCF